LASFNLQSDRRIRHCWTSQQRHPIAIPQQQRALTFSA
jgi:hypothetical protein